MKGTYDTKFLVTIAKRYFNDGLSQQQVAEEFGISRPTVSNLLKRCRQEGIVDIRISEPTDIRQVLADELSGVFPVSQVMIAESRHDYVSTLESVGETGAEYLRSVLTSDSRVGVSWGSTLFQIVRHMPHINLEGVEIIQLAGGTFAENPNYDSYEVTRALAVRLHGTYRILPAPFMVTDTELHNKLTREPGILNHLDYIRNTTMVLAGVTSNNPETSALVKAGFIAHNDSAALIEKGIVGHINGYHFTREGTFPDIVWNRMVVGLSLDTMRQTPLTVAACGRHKVEVISAAMKTGIIDTLITDEHTARQILDNHRGI